MIQSDGSLGPLRSAAAAASMRTEFYARYGHLVRLAVDLAELNAASALHLAPEEHPVLFVSRRDGHVLPVMVTVKPDGRFRYLWNGSGEADTDYPATAAKRIAAVSS